MGTGLPTLADRFDSRANGIGVLRLVLAFAVLLAHSWPLALGRSMLGVAETTKQTDVGRLAVYGFFVLSGFLITGSALRFSLPRYLWHRALRILPGLWVCLLLTALVLAPVVAYHERGTLDGFWDHPQGPWQYLRANWLLAMDQWTISGIFTDVPFGRGIKAGGPVNGSLWTLRYEVLCYLMLAALVAASVLARAPGAVLLLLLGTSWIVVEDFVRGAGRFVKPPKHGVLGPYPIVGVFEQQLVIYLAFVFLLGAAAKLYAHRLPMTGPLAVVAAVGFAATLRFGGFSVAGLPLLAYLVLYLAVGLPRWLHPIGRKRDYSYGVYIYAFPVQQLVALFIGVRYGFVTYLVVSAAGTLLLAALSWHLVERPAMSLKDLKVRRRPRAAYGGIMSNGLADHFLLLALDDQGNHLVGDPALDYGLAGAVLLDLMLAGRLDLADDRVVVTDATPTGDPVADAALARIAADHKPRKPDAWIQPLTDGLRGRLLDRQVSAGVLRRDQDRVLWVFPRTRYASATGAEPAAETAVRRELTEAVDGTGDVPARTAALLGLVQAVGLAGKLFPGRDGNELKARLDAIAKGNWAADAVRQTIARMQAIIASMTAVTVATTVITTSG